MNRFIYARFVSKSRSVFSHSYPLIVPLGSSVRLASAHSMNGASAMRIRPSSGSSLFSTVSLRHRLRLSSPGAHFSRNRAVQLRGKQFHEDTAIFSFYQPVTLRAVQGGSGGSSFSTDAASATLHSSSSSSSSFERDRRSMGWWLMGCAGLVFVMIVVGGVTRLTESGLSMTEWRPLLGALPPRSDEEWNALFDRYKATPEYKKLREEDMTLGEFKRIFFWEYGHRVLGRVIGVAFAVPGAVFLARGAISARLGARLLVLFSLGGAQGVVGWWMVKSGLDEQHIEARDGIPRVSHYRLMFHLVTAFTIFSGLLWNSLALLRPAAGVHQLMKALPASASAAKAAVPLFRRSAQLAAGATFLTAASGALVAGLDAGLVYNEWPLMGGQLMPEDSWSQDPWWKNLTRNSSMVQFEHRTLAYTTVLSVALVQWAARRGKLLQKYAPKSLRLALVHVGVMVLVQVTLGISTLVHFVPVPLAAAHQAGSVTLLSFSVWLLHELRRKVPRF